MKRQFLLTILIIFTLVVALPQMAAAISFEQVSQIAKQTTVLIDGCNSGSGVIFRHEGNNYYVLTAKHVVENAKLTCLVITPDGARQEVDASKTTIPVAGVDLAVVQFTSNQNYQLAQFGDSNQATPGKIVYVAGASEPSEAIPQRTLLVVPGNIVGIQSPQSGYSLIYTNPTRRGMSGSPVLNEEGKVIGIHGQGDQQDGGKTGLNLGIPIQVFLNSSQPLIQNLPVTPSPKISNVVPSPAPSPQQLTEDDKARITRSRVDNKWWGCAGWGSLIGGFGLGIIFFILVNFLVYKLNADVNNSWMFGILITGVLGLVLFDISSVVWLILGGLLGCYFVIISWLPFSKINSFWLVVIFLLGIYCVAKGYFFCGRDIKDITYYFNEFYSAVYLSFKVNFSTL